MVIEKGLLRLFYCLLVIVVSLGSTVYAQEAQDRWEATIKAFEEADRDNPPPLGGIVFVGSSSIRGWKTLQEDFPEHRVINRGFGGSAIADSTRHAHRIIIPCRPRMVVLYAGDNDIAGGRTPKQFLADFRAFVREVQADLPDVRIAFISIKPSPLRWRFAQAMQEANTLVEDYARRSSVDFIDVFKPMLGSDGKPRKELFLEDNLHLNREGYMLWTALVRPYLEEERRGKVRGYINSLPSESASKRSERHKRIADRRRTMAVLVHRGASKFAPENTLEAYAAAMARGADGCEIDIRSTIDGVLYLHHDDDLGRTVEGSGPLQNLSYYDLLGHKLRAPLGAASEGTRVPTLVALVELARRTGMLLHLDIKERGLESSIRRLFDEADIWDHIVHINASPNSDGIRFDPRLRLLAYKGWLPENASENADALRAFLDQPGDMVFVKDDPGECVRLLGRDVFRAGPTPEDVMEAIAPDLHGLEAEWTPTGPAD